MQHSSQIKPIEKIISILSYFTMGIIGLIFIIITNVMKKRLRYFFMYNIMQSMLISILFAAFKLILDVILYVIALVPFLASFAAGFNYLISVKLISSSLFSFNLFQLLVFILLCYVSVGILINRIFYIPLFTRLTQLIMKDYE